MARQDVTQRVTHHSVRRFRAALAADPSVFYFLPGIIHRHHARADCYRHVILNYAIEFQLERGRFVPESQSNFLYRHDVALDERADWQSGRTVAHGRLNDES